MATVFYRCLGWLGSDARGFARRLGAVGYLGLVACSSTPEATGPGAIGELTRRDTTIVHQDCAVGSAGTEKMDINGDGRPDILIVRSGSREVCRSVDLNFDGVVDSWVYNDGGGALSRRENDYDRDGRIDEIAIYKGGVLVEKQRATTLAGKLDTWDFYQGGKLGRTERDSDGDAVVDQWWEYPKAERLDCPMIHSDVDGDGRPDPGATVDVCSEYAGYVPPERGEDKAPGATFESSTGVPTEVDEKPMPEGQGEQKQ